MNDLQSVCTQSGATNLEYCLVCCLICVTAIASIMVMGHSLANTFSSLGTTIDDSILKQDGGPAPSFR